MNYLMTTILGPEHEIKTSKLFGTSNFALPIVFAHQFTFLLEHIVFYKGSKKYKMYVCEGGRVGELGSALTKMLFERIVGKKEN